MPRVAPPPLAAPRLALLCALLQLSGVQGFFVRQHSYVGTDFFKRWWFWHWPDLTHGHVEYVNETVARSAGLINASADRAYIGVDMWSHTQGEPRRSVKIYSNDVYESGLFVITLDHMPSGCGTWPAFWMVGGNSKEKWPAWGEIDIIESVHMHSQVSTTLHTDAGCEQAALVSGRDFTGQWLPGSATPRATNCDVHAPGQWANQGCGQRGPEGSAGPPFNARGGGTFALQWWPEEGIKAWFWPMGTEPLDLRQDSASGSSSPKPWTWGSPYARFDLAPGNCPKSHFRNLRLVFDLALCGDMAEQTYGAACPAEASQWSCQELVSDHPEAFADAYWSVRRLDVYQWRDLNTVFGDVMHHVMTAASPLGHMLGSRPSRAAWWAAVPLGLAVLTVAASCWRRPLASSPWHILGSVRRGVVRPLNYAPLMHEAARDQQRTCPQEAP